MDGDGIKLWVTVVLCYITVCFSVTDPGDFKVLNDFKNGLENSELLKWPEKGGDPCGPPSWPHVFCSNGRVTQIQVQGMGLKGTLPLNFNRLEKLQNLGLQKNSFNGPLPSFSGLAELQFVYLDFNQFDTIPLDFFHGLDNVRVLALDDNPFNSSTGWSIPNELQDSVQLSNFSCSSCNLIGPLPDFFGNFSSLSSLRLSYNRLSGELPVSFRDSMLQILWLNDQDGDGMTGSIDVIESMVGLTQVWLHGNHFTGTIPNGIGALTSLRELNLNRNQLVGPIPLGLANLNLQLLDLNNNMLMGPIPKFKAANVTYSSNSFCQSEPSEQCSPQVIALLDFLSDVNFPPNLASQWGGNDPCEGPWWGITCNSGSQVSVINLQRLKLNGTLSPSLANLDSLLEVHLGGNNLGGPVPSNLTQLKSLRLLELSGNNFEPPLPIFRDSVKIIINGNPLLIGNRTKEPPSPSISPSLPSPSTSPLPSSPINPFLSPLSPLNNSSPLLNVPPSSIEEHPKPKKFKAFKLVVIVVTAGACMFLVLLVILFCIYCIKKKNYTKKDHGPIVVHPRDPSDPDNMVKIAISNDAQTGSLSECRSGGGVENTHVIESGNLVISVQVLRKVTDNFSPENELGRGGFGTVYKGKLDDGTKLAVKRMEAGAIGNKALDEFHAEISVLSKVRHRHLVSLLGYSIEGNERLLVYEYLSKGALSLHLFRWKEMNLEPLSWTRRISIALDVARGMEYLHSLAHQIFIHRDLKSSNILLDDDFRAKVSDFGLVKLAPDRERSFATRLAGTFGYLAPEYAVTGKITTKVDVFSFGVVLIELLTGLTALDDHRPEESRYLVEWFWHIKSNRVRLHAIIDSALDLEDEIFDSMSVVAELAGHCTARDPNHRPDMGQAVNVLSSLVEKWKPFEEPVEEYSGIDFTQRLPQMLKCWQEAANIDISGTSLQDSKGSIPARAPGFADSFNSSDAR